MSTIMWTNLGRVEFCPKGWPKFPKVARGPGLYRLGLRDEWTYIGQARNLQHRLNEYRRPTHGVVQEHSIHRAIQLAGGADVDVFTSEILGDVARRCALERTEISSAELAGMKLLNGGSHVRSYRLKLDIAYHERELSVLREKLSAFEEE